MVFLHHVAIQTSRYEWYIAFFQDVFEMTYQKDGGTEGNRKYWFNEGIQINENFDIPHNYFLVHHIAIHVADVEETINRAINYGAERYKNNNNWIILSDGLIIELMS